MTTKVEKIETTSGANTMSGGFLPLNLEAAIDELVAGSTITAAAKKIGIRREVLSTHVNNNLHFQARLNQRRREIRDECQGAVVALFQDVAAAVRRVLADPKTPPGVILQSGLNFLAKSLETLTAEIGPGDVESLAKVQADKDFQALLPTWGAEEADVQRLIRRSLKMMEAANENGRV